MVMRIFRKESTHLSWQEGKGLWQALLDTWIIFNFQKKDKSHSHFFFKRVSLWAKGQTICWRKKRGVGKNNIIFIQQLQFLGISQKTTGGGKPESKSFDLHQRKNHVWLFAVLASHIPWMWDALLQGWGPLVDYWPFLCRNVPLTFPGQKRFGA